MAKVEFSLSSKEDKILHQSEVMIRFIGGRGYIYRAKTGVFIDPKRWNAEDGKVKMPKKEFDPEFKMCAAKRKELSEIENDVIQAFIDTDKDSIKPGENWLKTYLYNRKHPVSDEPLQRQAFFETFDEFLIKHKLSDVRKKNFRVIKRAMQRFELYTGTTFTFDNFSDETLRELNKFLKAEHTLCEKDKYRKIYEAIPESRIPQPRGQNTLNDIFTKIRTFFLWCINSGKTENNPFKNFSIDECTYGRPVYLDIKERERLYHADLSNRPQIAIQRDIFVFQCVIGCRVGDLYKMTKSNIINGAIEYIPRKTKEGRPVLVRVPLNSIASEILKRYSDHEGETLLPFISEQKYNQAIKTAFRLAGLDRIVTILDPLTREGRQEPLYEVASSHMARRCFVGNLYRQVKDPNLVGALSGHKEGSKAFARYRDIDEGMRQDLVKLLE